MRSFKSAWTAIWTSFTQVANYRKWARSIVDHIKQMYIVHSVYISNRVIYLPLTAFYALNWSNVLIFLFLFDHVNIFKHVWRFRFLSAKVIVRWEKAAASNIVNKCMWSTLIISIPIKTKLRCGQASDIKLPQRNERKNVKRNEWRNNSSDTIQDDKYQTNRK